jgi:hypothetical protein
MLKKCRLEFGKSSKEFTNWSGGTCFVGVSGVTIQLKIISYDDD